MDTQIPLISTSVSGPLGIAHLPRLWQKMLLAAHGKLAEGYRAGEGGFDGLLLDALGIAPADAVAFVEASLPTYPEFEAWVTANGKPEGLTAEAITALNKRMLEFPKPEPGRSEMLEALGFPLDDRVWLGVELNDLDDWSCFHKQLVETGD